MIEFIIGAVVGFVACWLLKDKFNIKVEKKKWQCQ